ncbi:conserved hypothetical protein [Luteimonas sp. 9C]|nr:conserved hypothetical protein [Luteimonas sp. 9C]
MPFCRSLLLWLLPLRSLASTHSRRHPALAYPEGAAHGWAAFSDRGRMPSRKVPKS